MSDLVGNPNCWDSHVQAQLFCAKHVGLEILVLGHLARALRMCLFFIQNKDCGYPLEAPRRCGSKVYPQSKMLKISKFF